MSADYSGHCLCGEITYEITGEITKTHICHCGQCRRQSGHCLAAGNAEKAGFKLLTSETLDWFESSPGIRRGFCRKCGSNLFWDNGDAEISINLGALKQPTGLKVAGHIFVADKADYYNISDDLPKHDYYD